MRHVVFSFCYCTVVPHTQLERAQKLTAVNLIINLEGGDSRPS